MTYLGLSMRERNVGTFCEASVHIDEDALGLVETFGWGSVYLWDGLREHGTDYPVFFTEEGSDHRMAVCIAPRVSP